MARTVVRGVVLLVLSLALTCCGRDPGQVSVSTPSPALSPALSPTPSSTPQPTRSRQPDGVATVEPAHPSPTKGSSPSRLEIPAIGLSTSLITLGLNEDGTVEVPEDPARAGWFDLGTVPGQRGSAVILGHVDSLDGPAVFADLATLRAGDHITVGLSDESVMTFQVTRVATFANADFPAQRVYAGTPGRPALNLVTCGGDYDPDRGGYQANVVVFTELTAD